MSLNLHAMVRTLISTVNSDITAALKRNAGYTTNAAGKRVPAYETTTGSIQVQALSNGDLKHMNDLNIQGIMRKVYMYGDWGGPVRADATGGDVLVFPHRDNIAAEWKIVTVFEAWDGPGWSCVGVVLQ